MVVGHDEGRFLCDVNSNLDVVPHRSKKPQGPRPLPFSFNSASSLYSQYVGKHSYCSHINACICIV